MTHLKAKELFKAGKVREAWEVAQQDEGWNGDTGFECWEKWMQGLAA